MGSSSGGGKLSVFWVVVFPLMLAVGLGGFIYFKVTSAVQAARGGSGLVEVRDEARSQAATSEADKLTATLVEFAKDVQEGQVELAQTLAARPYRESMDSKRFAAHLTANPYLRAGGTFIVRTQTMRNGAARWEGTFETSAGAVTLVADFSSEGSEWRLSSLMVGGMQTFPSF